MRQSLIVVLAAALVVTPAVSSAQNVTATDLIKLSAAGLSDDVLVALIESDGVVFKLAADDILSLRDRGLSQKVIIAMLQTAKKPAPVVAAPALSPEAQPVPRAPEVMPSDITEPPPVVVNVTQQVEQTVEQSRERTYTTPTYVSYPVAVPVYVAPRRHIDRKPEPVYWGFGGQRRPDTWKDAKPATPPRVNRQ